MKRWFGVGGLVVGLGVVLSGGCRGQRGDAGQAPGHDKGEHTQTSHNPKDGPPPKIVFGDTNHDFGSMDQEETGRHVFEIRNEGEGVLQLRFIEKSCGCTGLTIEDLVWTKEQKVPPNRSLEVPPGGKSDLEFAWNTEQRSHLRTVARLATNDPGQQIVEFAVEGDVIPSVEVSQQQVAIAELRNTDTTTASVTVFSRRLEDLEVTEVEASHYLVSATWEPVPDDDLELLPAKKAYRVIVNIAPGLPLGPFRTTLTIHTNAERRPTISVEMGGRVTGEVTLTPSDTVDFQTVRVAEGSRRNLFIKMRGDDPVQVKVVRVVPEFLKVEFVPAGENRYQLKVQVPPRAPGGVFKGSIELETTHLTAKSVNIPVRGQVIQ